MKEQTERSSGGNKPRRALRLLKDLQTAIAGTRSARSAAASGGALQLQEAVIRATSGDSESCLPEEKYVQQILAAGSNSRNKVSFCTQALVTRLYNTQDSTVALKTLFLIHRALLDGGFLFQDQLTASCSNTLSISFDCSSSRKGTKAAAASEAEEGRDYHSLELLTTQLRSAVDDDHEIMNTWVCRYASYLDQRLICSSSVKSHFDSKWSSAQTSEKVCFMPTEQVLADLLLLQRLLEQCCDCGDLQLVAAHDLKAAATAGRDRDRRHGSSSSNYNILANNPVIQGALILVVADSYKLQQEIGLRLREMLDRLDILETSETLELLQICKRSGYQSQSLLKVLENCREQLGNLLSDLPLPQSTGFVSEFEMKKVEDSLAVKKHKTAASSDDQSSSDFTASQLICRSFDDTLQNLQKDDVQHKELSTQVRSSSSASSSRLEFNLIDFSSDPAAAELVTSSLRNKVDAADELSKDLISWVPLQHQASAESPDQASTVRLAEWEQLLVDSLQTMRTSASSKNCSTSSSTSTSTSSTTTQLLNTIPSAATHVASNMNHHLEYDSFYPYMVSSAAAARSLSWSSFSTTSSLDDHMNHTGLIKLAAGSMQAANVATIAGASHFAVEVVRAEAHSN
ncbi:unnamed protein product [Sphagnum jensenii]|uniref:ENTH domain-containing protein n=1 Tax=Sphagnum jensenii TaxID=128206 RepID=A0ABP0XH14_9BRYO